MSVRYLTLLILLSGLTCRADDTAWLQALLSRPNEVTALSGNYVITQPVELHRTGSIVGTNATIICRDAGDNAFASKCLSCAGEMPELVSASESATAGSDVTNAGCGKGDMLCLFNPTLSSYSGHRPYYHAGEFARGTSPGRIAGAWMASYSGCQLYRYRQPATCRITGVEIRYEGPLAPVILSIARGHNIALKDVVLSGSPSMLCCVSQSLGVTIDGCRFEQLAMDSQSTGTNYALCIANSQEVRVSNSTMIGLRHAFTAGGGSYSTGYPVPVNRLISVDNCDLYSTFNVAAADAHGNTERWSITTSRIHGGVNVGGNLGRVSGNTIIGRDESQAGVAIYASEWSGCDHDITDNTIHGVTTASYNARAAIYLQIGVLTTCGGTTTISGNRATIAGSIGNVRGVMIHNGGSSGRWRINLVNNVMMADVPATAMVKYLRSGTAARFLPSLDNNNTFIGGPVVKIAGDFAP